MRKQTCFDPRDPDYDGPEDDEEYDGCDDFEEEYDDDGYDDPANDYIMTEPELRGHL